MLSLGTAVFFESARVAAFASFGTETFPGPEIQTHDAHQPFPPAADALRLEEKKRQSEARKLKRAVLTEVKRLDRKIAVRSYLPDAADPPSTAIEDRLPSKGRAWSGTRVAARDLERLLGRPAFLVWVRLCETRGHYIKIEEQHRAPIIRRNIWSIRRADKKALSYSQIIRALRKLAAAGLVQPLGFMKQMLPQRKDYENNPEGEDRLTEFFGRAVFGDAAIGWMDVFVPRKTLDWAKGAPMRGGSRKGAGRQSFERLTLEDLEHLPDNVEPFVALRDLQRSLPHDGKAWKWYRTWFAGRSGWCTPPKDRPSKESWKNLQRHGLINEKEQLWAPYPLSNIGTGAVAVPAETVRWILEGQLQPTPDTDQLVAAEAKRKERRSKRLFRMASEHGPQSKCTPSGSPTNSDLQKKSSSSSSDQRTASLRTSGPDLFLKKKDEIKRTPSGARYIDDGETIRLLPTRKKRHTAPILPTSATSAKVVPITAAMTLPPDDGFDLEKELDKVLNANTAGAVRAEKIAQEKADIRAVLAGTYVAPLPFLHVDMFCPLPSGQDYLCRWPSAPDLDLTRSTVEHAQQLALLYCGAVECFYKRRSYAFNKGRHILAAECKHADLLFAAAAEMARWKLEPAKWIAWSIDVWDSMREGKKKMPPPASWMFSLKRLQGMRSWFCSDRAGYCIRRAYMKPRRIYDPFMAKIWEVHALVGERCPRGGSKYSRDEMIAYIKQLFPRGYQTELREVLAEAQYIQGGLDHKVATHQWVWI